MKHLHIIQKGQAMDSDSLSVLLIEDSETQARAIRDALESAGVSPLDIVTTRTLAEALRAGHFDVVVADLNLPDSEGPDTIRAVANGSAVIVASDFIDTPKKVSEAYDAGAHLAIPKADLLAISPSGIRAILEFARVTKRDIVRRKRKTESLLQKIDELAHGRIAEVS